MKQRIELVPLKASDKNQFVLDNQKAFKYGATEEFGLRDDHFEEDGEIISRKTIETSIDAGEAYRIQLDGTDIGGLVVNIEGKRGRLELLFVSPSSHGKGIGYAAWCLVEEMFPQVEIWETCTPYFEVRNIHFYINKCGFHAVEFFNALHHDPNEQDEGQELLNDNNSGGMFRFEKYMRKNKAEKVEL